ncbi:MAG: hypothetical protein ABGW91_10135 [Christiangramia sp.]
MSRFLLIGLFLSLVPVLILLAHRFYYIRKIRPFFKRQKKLYEKLNSEFDNDQNLPV